MVKGDKAQHLFTVLAVRKKKKKSGSLASPHSSVFTATSGKLMVYFGESRPSDRRAGGAFVRLEITPPKKKKNGWRWQCLRGVVNANKDFMNQ